MKTIILFVILFSATLLSQNVWYIDRDAPGSANGTSWNNAWRNPGQITWSSISAGDTIYISGGADSTYYSITDYYGWAVGIQPASTPSWTFASGNPVVVTRAWHSGHNGEVWFGSERQPFPAYIMRIGNISNVKFTGFTFYRGALQVGNGDWGATDSLIYLENNHFLSTGEGGSLAMTGSKIFLRNNIFEQLENDWAQDNDPIGINTGRGGHVIDNNVFIMRNGYETLPGGTSTSITSNSLTDNSLNMSTNYHVNNAVFVDGYYLQITSNDATTFYSTHGWQFETIQRTSSITITSTTMQHSTENFGVNSMVNTYLIVGTDTLLITSNDNYTFTGSGGWYPNTPSSGTHTWRIVGAGQPVSGRPYVMGGAHRDIIQFSNFGFGNDYGGQFVNEMLPMVVSNNFIIDTRPEGTNWNAVFYSSGPNCRVIFYVYNNILVSRKTKDAAPGFWFHAGGAGYDHSVHVINNTLIAKGTNTGTNAVVGNSDTTIILNNLFVIDTTITRFLNTGSIPETDHYIVNYNAYISQSDIAGVYFPDIGFGAYVWGQWRAQGFDANSIVGTPDTVYFDNKYGLEKSDYYTSLGRRLGTNLYDDYPFLRTDILGNPRPLEGAWDIGALQYIAEGVDTVPLYSFTAVTNAELDSAYVAYSVFTGADSTFTVYTTTVAQFKIGALDTYSAITKYAEAGDTVFIQNTSSAEYSTLTTQTLVAGGVTRSFNVTTKAEPPPPTPSQGGWLNQVNGRKLFFNNGRAILTRQE